MNELLNTQQQQAFLETIENADTIISFTKSMLSKALEIAQDFPNLKAKLKAKTIIIRQTVPPNAQLDVS